MKKLDTSRPYGTVNGEGEKPWHFEQDGKRYDANMEYVEDDPHYKPPKAAPGAPKTDRELTLEQRLADQEAATKKAVEEALAKQAADFEKKLAEATGKGPKSDPPADEKEDAAILADLHDHTNDELRAYLKKNRVHFESDANKDALVKLAYPVRVKAEKKK